MFALFLHMFVLGWFEGECLYALNTFVRAPLTQSYAIRENGLELNIGTVMDEVVRITADDYTFGGSQFFFSEPLLTFSWFIFLNFRSVVLRLHNNNSFRI